MSTDTPKPRAETSLEWAPLPPAAPARRSQAAAPPLASRVGDRRGRRHAGGDPDRHRRLRATRSVASHNGEQDYIHRDHRANGDDCPDGDGHSGPRRAAQCVRRGDQQQFHGKPCRRAQPGGWLGALAIGANQR
jgi:hypothetical protein